MTEEGPRSCDQPLVVTRPGCRLPACLLLLLLINNSKTTHMYQQLGGSTAMDDGQKGREAFEAWFDLAMVLAGFYSTWFETWVRGSCTICPGLRIWRGHDNG